MANGDTCFAIVVILGLFVLFNQRSGKGVEIQNRYRTNGRSQNQITYIIADELLAQGERDVDDFHFCTNITWPEIRMITNVITILGDSSTSVSPQRRELLLTLIVTRLRSLGAFAVNVEMTKVHNYGNGPFVSTREPVAAWSSKPTAGERMPSGPLSKFIEVDYPGRDRVEKLVIHWARPPWQKQTYWQWFVGQENMIVDWNSV